VADATDILARFRTFWNTWGPHIGTGISIDFDPICLAIEASTGVLTGAFAGTDPTTVVGGAVGDLLPRQTQGLLRLNTSTVIGGRRVRGRLFIPGALESDNSSAQPTGTYLSDLNVAAATLLAAGATASSLVVWHRPTPGVGGGASPAVTGVSAAPTWSVLRSRRD
jgi:hypothetical protein